jgi:DNA end-binding protein Ku
MQAVWSGTISFGLIHIPIKLYSAEESKRLNFRLLSKKDLCPIKYLRVCRSTGEEVPYGDIVKGYKYEDGDYVILDQEDFEKAGRKRSKTIEVVEFTDIKGLSSELFERPYYIEPAPEAEKAYVLLREAMKKSGKAGIAKFVLRNKEQLAAIIPRGDLLIVDILRFKEDLREPKELHIPGKSKYEKKELDIAVQLIEQLSEPFRHEKFKDTYSDELKEVIGKKAKGKRYKPKEEEPVITADVADIMDKLKKSLERARGK